MTEARSIAQTPAQAHIDPGILNITRQYAALDWRNETTAVLFAAEHRTTLH